MADDASPKPLSPLGVVDSTVSHSARIWNYWLGGKGAYDVDRRVGDEILAYVPELIRSARADRHFLTRAVHYLAAEAGVRQFLDIGTGLPWPPPTRSPSASRLSPASPTWTKTRSSDGEAMTGAVDYWNSQGTAPMRLRTRDESACLFDRVTLVEPGVVSCSRWRPREDAEPGRIADVTHVCGVGVKR